MTKRKTIIHKYLTKRRAKELANKIADEIQLDIDWLKSKDGLRVLCDRYSDNIGVEDAIRKMMVLCILDNSRDPTYILRNGVLQFYYQGGFAEKDVDGEPEKKYAVESLGLNRDY